MKKQIFIPECAETLGENTALLLPVECKTGLCRKTDGTFPLCLFIQAAAVRRERRERLFNFGVAGRAVSLRKGHRPDKDFQLPELPGRTVFLLLQS